MLTTQLQLAPRSRMCIAKTSAPSICLHGMDRDTLTFIFTKLCIVHKYYHSQWVNTHCQTQLYVTVMLHGVYLPIELYNTTGWIHSKYRVLQKELYNFESLQKFIQRTYTTF
jgi:hypothetical protein